MTYRGLMFLMICLFLAGGLYVVYNAATADPKADPEEIEITMYRGEDCECCVDWADYLEEKGMTVIDRKVENLPEVKQQYGIHGAFQSCHTGVVDGYVVEGHVPANEIQRLVAQQPEAIGIAVPGMPAGSPGMEVGHTEPYEVLLFDREKYSVFAEY